MPRGIYPRTKEHNEAISRAKKSRTLPPQCGFQKGHPQFNTGRTHFKKNIRSAYWKGGKIIDGYGYIKIYNPTHPFCDAKGYVKEHRLIMEKKLGKYLSKTGIVHHINGIRTDNRIENLMLFKNNGEHMKYCHPIKKGVGFQKGNIPWNKGKHPEYMMGNKFAKDHL